jgi:hypothetical protein
VVDGFRKRSTHPTPPRDVRTHALSEAALEKVSGGFLVFQFRLVAVKTVG